MILNHVEQHGHKPVTPTLRMLRYWWGRFNAEVFAGELLPCQFTIGPTDFHIEVEGMCYPLDNGRVRIHLDSRVNTRAGMLGTLAHEMVHQHQFQNNLTMHHGETFTRWAEPILGLTGLTI